VDALKSIRETEKNPKKPSRLGKNTQTQKNPKKKKKTKKNSLGWVFLKNPGFFQPC
jgi:hypothetical protein